MAREEMLVLHTLGGIGFSQLPLTSGEIKQSWWKHGATLEKIQLKKMFHVDEADVFGSSHGLNLSSFLSNSLSLIYLNGRERSQI